MLPRLRLAPKSRTSAREFPKHSLNRNDSPLSDNVVAIRPRCDYKNCGDENNRDSSENRL